MEWCKKLTEQDGIDVDEILQKEYGNWLRLGCCYAKLDSKKNIVCNMIIYSGLIVLWLFSIAVYLTTAIISMSDLAVMSETLHFAVLISLVFSGHVNSLFQRNVLSTLHRVMHKHVEYPGIEHQLLTVSNISNSRKFKATNFWRISVLINTMFLLIISPWMDSIFKFEDPENDLLNNNLPMKCWVPFESSSGIRFVIALTWQVVSTIVGSVVLTNLFLIYIVLSEAFCYHLRVLKASLENIEDRVQYYQNVFFKHSDVEYAGIYGECLEISIRHHIQILENFASFKQLVSFTILLTLFFGSIMIACDGIVLVMASGRVATLLKSVSFFTAEIFAVGGICYFGEQISELSMEVREVMFQQKWYICSPPVKKSVFIFMENTKTPLTLSGGGLLPATMATFGNILNGAYSYFNLLRTFNQ